MDKILIAVSSNDGKKIDEKKIAGYIAELNDLSHETLKQLLNSCSSQELALFIKQEFFKQINARNMKITGELAEELRSVSTENTRNVVELSDHVDESEDLERYDKNLTEEEAIKKHSFNNSKYDKALEMFLGAFKANVKDINFDKAVFLSKCIVEHHISEFSSTFPKEVRSKSHNLRENSKLCLSVYTSKIDTSDFVKMLPAQMQSEELRSRDSEYIKESLLASQVASAAADTDMFQCSKCKQKKCTYSQLQTRSCDEPMTTFVTCTNCGHRWKF
ncbi:transcription elongation factor S-II [Vittaforma corneae ATCC 50505]|uniref:Transcription elongation factor S-II n=1 Tax=Vittaforma corneae (strain ATCC 50505) TaxID=993615 RepID=L2GNF5_VITCO|nr:transcription elongation factor S-II [Vittaforma corneae ATCC 50505]ELA42428.1 transcription elongation factor S-II [Vittaforma corneae ATCC 50505]